MTHTSKIITAAILAASIPLRILSEYKMPLRPKIAAQVGGFCHTGVVTTVQQELNFVIEEKDGRCHFLFAEPHSGIHIGDIVVATGDLILNNDGMIREKVQSTQCIGRMPLPPPAKVPLEKLVSQDFLNRRVTTEGTLVLARKDEIDTSTIHLLVKDGATVLNAAFRVGSDSVPDVTSLLGARLRLTGSLQQASGARMYVPRFLSFDMSDGLEIVSSPPTDIFNAPRLNLDFTWSPAEIVSMEAHRFDGVVLATWGGDQMMLEGKNFRRVKAILARPEELPAVGEHVAVVGFPDTDLYAINLVYARCKPLPGKKDLGTEPKPANVTLRQLLTDDQGRPRINGYSHGRLLRIRGTVLDVQPSLALFSLNEDKLTLPVDCSSSPGVISRLEPGSMIETVCLAIAETDSWRESIVLPQTRGLKLILRSEADLKILARPPWWTPARLTAAIISLLVVIVLIIVANRIINGIMMRRKVSERTRLAVELHDSLSQTLAGVACQITAGGNAVEDDPKAAKDLLQTAERMLESSRTELKNCLFDLRNDTVDDPDFARAIERTLVGFKTDAQISLRFNVARSLMTDSAAHAVLCIIRELVANAIRHGSATHIRVAGVANGGHLRFSVRDNGSGFDPKQRPGPRNGHFGLSGIRERLAAMKGEMSIESTPRKGTKALVTIRLRTSDTRRQSPKSEVRKAKPS